MYTEHFNIINKLADQTVTISNESDCENVMCYWLCPRNPSHCNTYIIYYKVDSLIIPFPFLAFSEYWPSYRAPLGHLKTPCPHRKWLLTIPVQLAPLLQCTSTGSGYFSNSAWLSFGKCSDKVDMMSPESFQICHLL